MKPFFFGSCLKIIMRLIWSSVYNVLRIDANRVEHGKFPNGKSFGKSAFSRFRDSRALWLRESRKPGNNLNVRTFNITNKNSFLESVCSLVMQALLSLYSMFVCCYTVDLRF